MTTDATGAALVLRPATPGRLIFASPHSGVIYPADMAPDPALGQTSLRSAEDALVDQLIAAGPSQGATTLLARYGRAYVDLNRDPADLDPGLIEGLDHTASPRSAAGYGVIPRLAGDGRPLYARRLSLEEARERLARVHRPWNAALDDAVAEALDLHGQALLVDWHSMPERATRAPGGPRGPDVVLGDRHGSSCSPELTRALRTAFEALGWRVALNHPYAGGWTTQNRGRPDKGVHAIQIELNRALYFDESARTPSRGWSRTLKGVSRVIAMLGALRLGT
ncbi:N-formylglutamate amidohydrolase [Brevundimonas sp. FT23042]|uniref:N-formylglutamate amidohydrolase n=1 Tax=Brevundimonas sp. FT23042 TaxID=3393749 RepID=UPI003B587938